MNDERNRYILMALDQMAASHDHLAEALLQAFAGRIDQKAIAIARNALQVAGDVFRKNYPGPCDGAVMLWTLTGGELGVFDDPEKVAALPLSERERLREEFRSATINRRDDVQSSLKKVRAEIVHGSRQDFDSFPAKPRLLVQSIVEAGGSMLAEAVHALIWPGKPFDAGGRDRLRKTYEDARSRLLAAKSMWVLRREADLLTCSRSAAKG